MTNRLTQRNRGFSLVETLVAVLLLVVAIAGPLTVASRAFNAALVAKNQVVAFYLAQDVMEHVRFVRDSSCLVAGTAAPCPAATWLSGLSSCATSCRIDTVANTITACTQGSACDELYYDTTSKNFTHTGPASATNPKTLFRRVVSVTSPVGANASEALVTVTVYWREGISPQHSVVLKENLFNWQ
jgi:prepilin-type N-terminal cleavage/methylation domain-containing protein